MDKIIESSDSKKKFSFERVFVPGILICGSILIFQGWKYLPYSEMFPHFTLSEYVNQKNHYHAIFLSPISFQTTGHFLIYFPLMAYGLLLNSKKLSSRNLLIFYALNCLLSTLAVYTYEKYYLKQKMISPKCLGACTALSNIYCYLAINPQHLILGSRIFPYFLIPVIIGGYEFNEFSQGYVTEISRPSHLSSMVFGLIFGLMARKFLII